MSTPGYTHRTFGNSALYDAAGNPIELNSGGVPVYVVNGGSGGTAATDGDAFTPDVSLFTPTGGTYNTTPPALTNGDEGTLALTARRGVHSNLRNSAGAETGISSNPLAVGVYDSAGTGITATGTSLNVNITGGGSGGGAVTIADGADVTEGAIADAKVVGDNSGTVSAKLRGLNTTLSTLDGKVTACNTGAVVVASGAITATLAAETTKVIGTIRNLGNVGGVFDTLPDATAPANILGVGGRFVTTPATLTTGQAGSLQLTAAQNLKSDLTTLAGTAVDGNSGNKSAGTQRVVLATDQPALTNALLVKLQAETSGGVDKYSYISAASSNQDSQVIKASAGQMYAMSVFNLNASIRYLKIYDKATGPTSSDTPIDRIMIPGNATGVGVGQAVAVGVAFSTGISFRLTTGIADNDANAVAANEILVNVKYK